MQLLTGKQWKSPLTSRMKKVLYIYVLLKSVVGAGIDVVLDFFCSLIILQVYYMIPILPLTHTCTHLLPLSPFPPSPCLPSVDTPPPKKPKVESMTSPANSAPDSHPTTATASCYNSNGISNPHKDLNTTPSAALSTPSASSSTSSLAPNSQVPSHIQNSNHIAPQVSNSSANIGSGSRSSSSSVVNQHASHFNVGGHLAAAVTNSTGQQPPTHGQQHTNDVSVNAQISHK